MGSTSTSKVWQSTSRYKVKGRLGHDDGDDKEMRVLNRLLKITEHGLIYEPDPRHIELRASSLGIELDLSKPNVTPGKKLQCPDELPADDSIDNIIASIKLANKTAVRVSFNTDPR